ncbi:MAG: helix-turn-helix transcriptional regulator [Clostridia bacterium]|nr:helix-turn-helix transcriptional regulator [Clostridia bacterium]
MKVDYVLLGERIKFWRQYRNFTQEKLAEKVELTPGFISLMETGKKRASLETLICLCKELEITLNELLVGNQITQPSDYSIEFAELLSNLNESERNLIFEIIKVICKALKSKD